jgi:hypothetical protein
MTTFKWMWAHLALAWNQYWARRVLPTAPFEAHSRYAQRMSRNRQTIAATFGPLKWR